MHPLLHPLFDVAAFTAGYGYYTWLRARLGDPIADDKRVWLIIGATLGALIGSHVLGALEDPRHLSWSWKSLSDAVNNRTVLGGLLGGAIGGEVARRIIRVHQRSGDLLVFPIILGMIISRIGSLLAGSRDSLGLRTTLPWGIDPGDGIQRHPTDIYEIIWLGLVWLALIGIERRWKLKPGARFRIFIVLYLEFRFCIEFLKPGHPVLYGLTAIQLAAEAGVLYYWKVWTEPKSLWLEPRADASGSQVISVSTEDPDPSASK